MRTGTLRRRAACTTAPSEYAAPCSCTTAWALAQRRAPKLHTRVHEGGTGLATAGGGGQMGAEERPRDRPGVRARTAAAAPPPPLRLCAFADRARFFANACVKHVKVLSHSPAAWGLADRPIDEEDEAAVLERLASETLKLDPNDARLSDLDAALVESIRFEEERKRNLECCVCLEKKELWTLNCAQSHGKHKMCHHCIILEKNKVVTDPTCGEHARLIEQWGAGREMTRMAVCCKCPVCRQPFASAWSPVERRPICMVVQRLPMRA
eukprot:6562607-Prymnesium_polylepis.3